MNIHTLKFTSNSVEGVTVSADFNGLTDARLVDIAAALEKLSRSLVAIGAAKLHPPQQPVDADEPSAPVIQPTGTQDSDTMWQGR